MRGENGNFQTSILDEIIVDNFAGGGGASTGIEFATGRPVDIAINHDPDAILMHKTNHPYTEHIQASVWDVDPREVCRGRPVGLAWFSPDCKHFSKAKGAALVDRNIRGLAWIVLRWAGTVRPRVIILENVEEFVTWCPVRKGKPVKKKFGETFQKWKAQLEALGYEVEYRELIAADYGAPTIRKRFVLIARCDGKPIVWPERTHGPEKSEEVKSGKLKSWISAAEIIDWSLPMYSVFATKKEIKEIYGVNAIRPLADNTLRRIIRGVDKFTIKSGKPFLVPTGYGERDGQAPRVNSVDDPLKTVVSTGKHNIVNPLLAPVTFSNTANSTGAPASEPCYTIRTCGGEILSSAQLIQYHTEQTENVRASGIGRPMNTIDGSNRYGLVSASLTEYYGNGMPVDLREPMHTATGHDREALVAVHLDKYFAGGYKGCGNGADEPVSTITVEPRQSLVGVHLAEFKGRDLGQEPGRPLRTITAQGGEFAVCSCRIERVRSGSVGRWPQIRELLNRFCGYYLKDDEIIVLRIAGADYIITDILIRMLQPTELYRAMGFPPDYIIDRDYTGRAYGKSKQVARCGNAVCPPMAEAVVRAIYKPAKIKITTMRQLDELIAI